MRGPFFVGILLAGCAGDTALPIDAACNPLGATGCLTPWPSNALGTTGFAIDTPITIELEEEIDPSTLASATILVDLTAGTRVAHTASVEARPDDVQAIRITAALVPEHRYAVAITNAVLDVDGDELAQPRGFAALLAGRYTDHEQLEEIRPAFLDLVDALEAQNIDTDDLVVAWDFTTK